jgi:light-regulated signal transduction histidine kinase (bacteriophytochrome)
MREKKNTIPERIDACRKFSLHVAHKLRNPLSAMMNLAYQMKKHFPRTPQTDELFAIFEEELCHMKLIGDELALFSRKSPGESCTMDMALFLTQLGSHFAKEYGLADAGFVAVTTPDPPFSAEIEPAFASLVLEALIFNALIRMEEKRPVSISVRKEGGSLVFSIVVPAHHDIGLARGRMEDLVASSEERVIVNLPTAMLEHSLRQRGGSLEVAAQGSDATTIEVRLPERRAKGLPARRRRYSRGHTE